METGWISEAGEVIIRLVESGGDTAVYALLWYLAYLILRIIVIGGVIWVVIHSVGQVIGSISKLHLDGRVKRVNLISDSVSKTFVTSVEGALQNLEEVVTKLEKKLDAAESISPKPSEPASGKVAPPGDGSEE